jgi:hypothetical protein
MNNGLTLGRGLTPFAVVCEGHASTDMLKSKVKKNNMVAVGGTLSLSDKNALTTNDISLPTEPYIAQEKMMGWSILVNCFHRHAMEIATNVRAAVKAFLPFVHPLVHQVSALHSVGMENLYRVMYKLQQDYFAYLHQVAINAPTIVAPTFQDVVNQVATGRVGRLSALPHGWYTALEGRPEAGSGWWRRRQRWRGWSP